MIHLFSTILLLASKPNSTYIIVSAITILALLIFSSLIAAAEVAFFALGPKEKEELKNEGEENNKDVLNLINKPHDLLATLLITINFVNVAIVILSSSLLDNLFPNENGESLIRFIVDVFLITTLILLIGEVIPKVYATKNSVLIAKKMAKLTLFISKLPPISWIRIFLVNGTSIIHKYAAK
jgi:putative hemolysin